MFQINPRRKRPNIIRPIKRATYNVTINFYDRIPLPFLKKLINSPETRVNQGGTRWCSLSCAIRSAIILNRNDINGNSVAQSVNVANSLDQLPNFNYIVGLFNSINKLPLNNNYTLTEFSNHELSELFNLAIMPPPNVPKTICGLVNYTKNNPNSIIMLEFNTRLGSHRFLVEKVKILNNGDGAITLYNPNGGGKNKILFNSRRNTNQQNRLGWHQTLKYRTNSPSGMFIIT